MLSARDRRFVRLGPSRPAQPAHVCEAPGVRTTGIGLGPDASGSARCDLDWVAGRAFVKVLVVGVDDDRVVAAVREADQAGIAVPTERAPHERLGRLVAWLDRQDPPPAFVTVDVGDACAAWAIAPSGDAVLDHAPWLVADGLLPRLAARHAAVTAALVAALVARAEGVGLAHTSSESRAAVPLAGSLPVLHV
jgi:hypothetical protein